MDVVDSLDADLRRTHTRVIAGVRADQYDDTTPCDGVDRARPAGAHDRRRRRPRRGGRRRDRRRRSSSAADPAAQFDARRRPRWRRGARPGVLDRDRRRRPGPMPGRVLAGINLLDTATHTWDLATATGQTRGAARAVAAAALEASRGDHLAGDPRPAASVPSSPSPAGAGPTEQLVAFLGRSRERHDGRHP